jgi:hypothetical protein
MSVINLVFRVVTFDARTSLSLKAKSGTRSP